jgi:hypothetical protein
VRWVTGDRERALAVGLQTAHIYTRLTFAIAANEDDTLVRLLKNLNILNKKYPIFDFDFDGFDSRVPAYRSPYSS